MKKVLIWLVALSLFAILIISVAIRESWDGGFSQAEFQLVFIDEHNKPVSGVQMLVKNEAGVDAFCYPVLEYQQGIAVVSDEDGMILFHHINLSPEYGGNCGSLFFLFPIGKCGPPIYYCHFILSGKEIASLKYNDLNDMYQEKRRSSLPTVKRKWNGEPTCGKGLPEHLVPKNRHVPTELDFPIISKTFLIHKKSLEQG